MAKTPTINYYRNTTFTFTHIYQKNGVNSTDGIKLLFTVKPVQNDDSASDATAILKKTVAMSGASTVVTINPGDLADTVAPGDYYFDIKIIESEGTPPVIYQATAGKFTVIAEPTNRES